jgi:hypothetical protein
MRATNFKRLVANRLLLYGLTQRLPAKSYFPSIVAATTVVRNFMVIIVIVESLKVKPLDQLQLRCWRASVRTVLK